MFKTIVVHVDDSDAMASRVRAAAQLANDFDAHLVGSAATGLSYASYAMLFGSLAVPPSHAEFDALRQKAAEQLDRFTEQAGRLGVQSIESRVIDDETRNALLVQSRVADLLVTGAPGPDSGATGWSAAAGLPAYLALHTGRPVLVAPAGYNGRALTGAIAAGWDGSLHAMRAITMALPLLQRAAMVHLLIVNPGAVLDIEGEEPGAAMALYLARHGVPVEVVVQRTDAPTGTAILRLAEERACGLIVAGAFGHTRLRELALGGVTRSLLGESPVPVLLAH